MNMIQVLNLRCRPYDSTSVLAKQWPFFEGFDERRDFVFVRDTCAVAVSIYACKDEHNPFFDNEEDTSERFTVVLFDTTDRKPVAYKRLTINIDKYEQFARLRVDIPISKGAIDMEHDYQVWCLEGWRRMDAFNSKRDTWRPVGVQPLRFFALHRLPSRVYSVHGAWLSVDEGPKLRNADYDHGCDEVKVFFSLHHNFGLENRQPEFWVRTVDADGHERLLCTELCTHQDEEGNLMPDFEVTAELDLELYPRDAVYIELMQFNAALAGCVIDTRFGDIQGTFEPRDCYPIHNYTYEDGSSWSLCQFGPLPDSGNDSGIKDEGLGISSSEITPSARLDNMVGLASVKKHIEEFTHLMSFARMREKAGLSFPQLPKHALFLGSPGTGKTTVAKIMGETLHELGVLSKGHVVVKERSSLTGPNYGNEEQYTRQAIEEAQGGILFIDEAYQLHQPADPKDPGHFVLDTLMTALADDSNCDWMLILAGYTKPTLRLLELNPGLASRLPATNHYYFEDYKPGELIEIARRYLENQQFTLTAEADEALCRLLTADYAAKSENFGNARHVMNVIQTQILPAMARRVMSVAGVSASKTSLLKTIEAVDIPMPTASVRLKPRAIGFIA